LATILENKQSDDKKTSVVNMNLASNNAVVLGQKSNPQVTQKASRSRSEDYEVIFAVDDSNVNQKGFDFAIQTAKNFSARLVLLYLIERSEVPAGFKDFAYSEGIGDYEWQYYSSLASERLRNLAMKADAASVEWTIQEHFGDVKSAMKWRVGEKRAIFVLNVSDKKGILGKIIRRLSSIGQQSNGVPVFVF
jgi:hypothetical protein